MNLKEIDEYFENLARKNILVQHTNTEKHYCSVNILDLLQANVKDLAYPAVMLEVPEGGYSGDTLDNSLFTKVVALSFLKYVAATDVAGQRIAYDEMEIIGRQFMSRIAQDYKTRNAVRVFRHNQVRLYKLSGVMNNCYGWRFEIPIGVAASELSKYDSSNWLTD